MKCIILAAGKGKRMQPLTLTTPKPMLKVLGKPLLEHIIDSLPKEISEIILVVGYKKEQIKEYFKDNFRGRTISYIDQAEALGTAHALHLCRPYLKEGERFMLMFADDLHSPEALKRLLKHDLAVLVTHHEDPSRFGTVLTDKDGRVIHTEEKPEKPKTDMVVVGVYVLDTRFFTYEMELDERTGEYFIPPIVNRMIKDHKMFVEETDFWHPIGYPEDITTAEEVLKKRDKVVSR
jgi:NDP-sugar pyrophosphorylase family protein